MKTIYSIVKTYDDDDLIVYEDVGLFEDKVKADRITDKLNMMEQYNKEFTLRFNAEFGKRLNQALKILADFKYPQKPAPIQEFQTVIKLTENGGGTLQAKELYNTLQFEHNKRIATWKKDVEIYRNRRNEIDKKLNTAKQIWVKDNYKLDPSWQEVFDVLKVEKEIFDDRMIAWFHTSGTFCVESVELL